MRKSLLIVGAGALLALGVVSSSAAPLSASLAGLFI